MSNPSQCPKATFVTELKPGDNWTVFRGELVVVRVDTGQMEVFSADGKSAEFVHP